jgi:opacity protein-like surface antigen
VRISTRIRNVLIGVVSAAALTTGVLAATAASASAATTAPAAPAAWHGCYGYGCIGKSAQAEGCSRDAATVYAISVYDGVRKTRVTLRLRYSPRCQSAWATVTDTGRPDGATFWIYDRGTHALEVASTQRAWFTRQWQTTKMVGVARTKAQACIEVHDRHGMSAPICTPFFGH